MIGDEKVINKLHKLTLYVRVSPPSERSSSADAE